MTYPQEAAADFDEYMRPKEAARYAKFSLSKLARLRMPENRHRGPPFSKVAGCVVYRRADLDAWLERHRVTGLTEGREQ